MKIAVIGAMDVEVENLKTTLNLKKEDNNDTRSCVCSHFRWRRNSI